MNYPKEFLQDLNDKTDIVSLAMQYTEPKPAGVDFVCKCPFHSEKTASLHLYTRDNSFYCFGCGTGGTALHFFMNAEGYTFTEAVAELAKRAGLSVPSADENSEEYKKTLQRARILEMNRTAARFYRDILWGLGEVGQMYGAAGLDGRIYLGARGVEEKIAKKFGLGYAPNSFYALKKHLRAKGYYDGEMAAAGLMASQDKVSADGEQYVSTYDKFRGRLMFPIIDLQGNIAGFSGRLTDPADTRGAKYLNSPETPVFRKREICFALNFAREAVVKEHVDYVLLCEGNLDVVSLYQAGFKTAAATLGTAVTEYHALLLRDRLKGLKKVITVFDSDAAGQKATEKALRILQEAGITADVLQFDAPDAKDPDEYIKKYGAEAFSKLLAASTPKLDYQLKQLIAQSDTQTVDGRNILFQKGCKFIAESVERYNEGVIAAELAKACGVAEEAVRAETGRRRGYIKNDRRKKEEEKLIYGGERTRTPTMAEAMQKVRAGNRAKLENSLVGCLIYGGEINADFVKLTQSVISAEKFQDEFCRKLYTAVAEAAETARETEKIALSRLTAEFTPQEWGIIQRMRSNLLFDTAPRQEVFEDILRNFIAAQ